MCLYSLSMYQCFTWYLACEIIFTRSPTLPCDIYTLIHCMDKNRECNFITIISSVHIMRPISKIFPFSLKTLVGFM